MRKHDEDQNATNHDNRSLTPRMKQFKNDEMGTTRKGRSHLCFIKQFLFLRSSQKFNAFCPTTSVRRSLIYFEPDLRKLMRVLYSFFPHSQCRCVPC